MRQPLEPLQFSRAVDHLDKLTREAMLVEHPSGALFVTGYGREDPFLYKSIDKGATWTWTSLSKSRYGDPP